MEKSKASIEVMANFLVSDMGYTPDEAWHELAEKLTYCLESHEFDLLPLHQAIALSSMVSRAKVIDLTGEDTTR